jgi:hypothetical protein
MEEVKKDLKDLIKSKIAEAIFEILFEDLKWKK